MVQANTHATTLKGSAGSIVMSDPHLEVIQQSFAAGFGLLDPQAYRTATFVPEAALFRSDSEKSKWSELRFDNHLVLHPSIDYSDNEKQLQVVKKHYENEFGPRRSIDQVVKDYRDDTVVHEVIDMIPATYHGREGVCKFCKDLDALAVKFDVQHVNVHHNHAQVFWKAETPMHGVVRGMDSFAFDDKNQITLQTTVAASEAQEE